MHLSSIRLVSLSLLYILSLLLLTLLPLEAVYIQRFSTTNNGGMLFTGNTLGLSKLTNANQPGSEDSAGTFITVDTTQQVGDYPPGTTLIWQENSSAAFLDLPDNSTVLYAELIWSGSYGFQGQITGNEPNTPITLITPQNVSFSITPDPATAQAALTPGFTNSGNYTRSANVTAIVQGGGAGQYIAGGIPGTISALDNTHNAAGWTLAVIYQNGTLLTYNMALFVGCEQASYTTNSPAMVTGLCVPGSGVINGNLFISAIEGDANKTGDHMLFGNSLPLTIAANSLSGVNNPVNNFFASQINTLLPATARESAGLDTRGSFGDYNADPFTAVIYPGDRQGYDITSINVTNMLTYNQSTAYALGTTTGDDYTINALGTQIQTGAPTITGTKLVNGFESVEAIVTDTVNFSFTLQNTGTLDTSSVVFKDFLESGLQYVSGTFTYNTMLQSDPDLVTGFALPTPLMVGDTATITFSAKVISYPPTGSIFFNTGTIDYQYTNCSSTVVDLTAQTNQVTIVLPSTDLPLIQATKTVNSGTSIDSSLGDVLTFVINLENIGPGDALNVFFQDSLEQGLTFVPGSVIVNDFSVIPDPDLSAGFFVGDILVGETTTVIFQATITSEPPAGNSFTNSANILYQYLPSEGDPVDLTTVSNQVVINLRPPPTSFDGYLKKCKFLNRTDYCLTATWESSDSTSVLFYRIYQNGVIVAAIDASAPPVYKACFPSKSAVQGLQIAAVYSGNIESTRVNLRIIQ